MNLGETNHLIPTVNSVNSIVIINEKKAYLDNDKIIIFDFIKDTVTSYVSKNMFEGINLKTPVVNRQDTLYYIKNVNNNKFLARLPVSDLNQIQPKVYSISSKKESPYKSYFAVILAALLCWTSYRLFTFKDHLKGLVLFDEKRIYFNQNSSLISKKQLSLIQHLEKKSFISSNELNTIISSKKYVKSHFTLLRTEFIEEINIILKSVTDNKRNLIEEIKDQESKNLVLGQDAANDNRGLIGSTQHMANVHNMSAISISSGMSFSSTNSSEDGNGIAGSQRIGELTLVVILSNT